MARKARITYKELLELAYEYMEECVNATKEFPTARGAVAVKSTKIPSIEFFLNYWIPKYKKMDSIGRSTFYEWWKHTEDKAKADTISHIQDIFNSILIEKVMNDPNSSSNFVAKNKLGWTDKSEIKNAHHVEQPLFPEEPTE